MFYATSVNKITLLQCSFYHDLDITKHKVDWPVNVDDSQHLWSTLFSIQLLSLSRKYLVIGQFNFSSVFLCYIGYHQSETLYGSGVLGQDYGIILGFITINLQTQMTPVSFVKTTESYDVFRLGHHLGSTFTETGRLNYRIGPGCAGRA